MVATTPNTVAELDAAVKPHDARWEETARVRATWTPWEGLSVVALLGATAGLYLWNLNASGWANAFYSAAVQAGTKSWSAFFFGSFDSANFITVDKPPAALWVMEISARLFGVNAWSILVPQALEGVAAVGLLYLTVRRWFSPAAALLAGAMMALTPVAALMFRFNNPDALLVLLLVASAYAMTRALEDGSTGWLLLAGSLIGFGFLTKMLQAFLVLPPFFLAYLVAGPVSLRRRLTQLVATGAATVVSAGWWVAAMVLVPASVRPYVGGSQNNSILNLIFGYNGFGRLTGDETGSVGGAPRAGGGRWGPSGLLRLFETEMGGQVSWLLPAAVIAIGVLLWLSWRAPRTDRLRAATIVWGGWLLVTGVVFSYAEGIIHPYYTVALAPAIGALAGIGSTQLWQRRDRWSARIMLAAGVSFTVGWAFVLLGRTPNWYPALRVGVVIVGLITGLALLFVTRIPRRVTGALVLAAIVAVLAGPAAYAAETAVTPHSGALPLAGPATASFGGRGGPAAFSNGRTGQAGGFGFPGGQLGRMNGARSFFGNGSSQNGRPSGNLPAGGVPGGFPGSRTEGSRPGPAGSNGRVAGLGGLLDARAPETALVNLLKQNTNSYTWVAATVGANNAAGIQLATHEAVMAVGGFNGTDPAPSLTEFQQYVTEGKIHYFIAGGGFGGPGGSAGTSRQITSWVEQTFSSTTVGGMTVYDLTQPATGS